MTALSINMKRILCLIATGLVMMPGGGGAQPEEGTPQWNTQLPPGRINLGVNFGDQQAESFGDLLVPLYATRSGLLFANPRGTWNDADGQESSLGLGYRHLFPDKQFIAGANIFCDRRSTALDNTFNQFGFGLEFLSKWVDARANFHLPGSGEKTGDVYPVSESTIREYHSYRADPATSGTQVTRFGYEGTWTYDVRTLHHYQVTERAMEGFDCEIGALLPIPGVMDHAEVKMFAGYYDYNAHYGDDVAGLKARLEVRPLPPLYLDAAWYEDEALLDSRYSVGVRASVPFDLAALSRGRNPFAGALEGFMPGTAKPPFGSRLTEMVVRDLHVRTEAAEPRELAGDRRILSKIETGADVQYHYDILSSNMTSGVGGN